MTHPVRNFERSDADPRLLAALAVGLVLFVAAVPLLLQAAYRVHDNVNVVAKGDPMPPLPRLQINPGRDLLALEASNNTALGETGWIDREHKIVRLPIERAKDLIVQRGLAGWPRLDAAGAASR